MSCLYPSCHPRVNTCCRTVNSISPESILFFLSILYSHLFVLANLCFDFAFEQRGQLHLGGVQTDISFECCKYQVSSCQPVQVDKKDIIPCGFRPPANKWTEESGHQLCGYINVVWLPHKHSMWWSLNPHSAVGIYYLTFLGLDLDAVFSSCDLVTTHQ